MKYIKMAGVATIAIATLTTSANAVIVDRDANVNFGILIEDACSIVIDNQGAFGISGDQKTLDSELNGGTTAQAQVTTNTLLSDVFVESPDAFAQAPANAEVGTTFSTSYNFDGILGPTTVRDGDTRTTLLVGTSNMNINAKAVRADEAFAAGNYQYVATLKCVAN